MSSLLTRSEAAPAELLTRNADIVPSTWNPETREFEIIFATPKAGVQRWDADGWFTEILAIDGFELRNGHVPFLDNHRRGSLDDQLGAIVSARTVAGTARAIVKLSRHHPLAERLAGDLADGCKFGVSPSYIVDSWAVEKNQKTGARTKTATKWTVHEISVAPVPADRLASTRGSDMPQGNPPAPTLENPAVVPSTAPAPAPAPNPAPVAERTDANQTLTRAQINGQIRSMGSAAGLTQDQINTMIDGEFTVDAASRSIMDEIVRRGQSAPRATPGLSVGVDHADPELRARSMGEALYARFTPGHNLSEQARGFAGMRIEDMARECLRFRSISSHGFMPSKLIERALNSTSDFPLLLGNAQDRTVRNAYTAASSPLKSLGRQVNVKDFRLRQRLQISLDSELKKLNEHGEIEASKFVEAAESYKIDTFARKIGVTRQVLVNDDLGVFSDLGRYYGTAAANTEAKVLSGLLNANGGRGPKMSDGKNLFHADHGNLDATATSIWDAAYTGDATNVLSSMRLGMRTQKGLAGEYISVTPKFLLVPPEGETAVQKLLTTVTPARSSDVNVFAGVLSPAVEPRLDNRAGFYMVADPNEIDGLEWSYLEGEEGIQIDTRYGWDVEGVEVKVRLDFGAGFVDTRGWRLYAGK